MKYLLLLTIVTAFFACNIDANDQSEDETSPEKWQNQKELRAIFERDIKEMAALFNSRDYVANLDYLPSEMFNYSPREQMVHEFEELNEMGMDMQFSEVKIGEVSKVIHHEDRYFCKVMTSSKTAVKLSGIMLYEIDELISNFEGLGGSVVEVTDSSFVILNNDTNYAIVDEDSETWKYLRYHEHLKPIINQIVPVQVRTGLE